MAPEQVLGQPIDGRTDLWALGVIMYEMLTGRRPFGGDHDVAIARAIVHTEAVHPSTLRPDITPDLDDVIWKLLRKDPGARHEGVDRVAADLAAILSGAAVQAPMRDMDDADAPGPATVDSKSHDGRTMESAGASSVGPIQDAWSRARRWLWIPAAAATLAAGVAWRVLAARDPVPIRLAVLPLENRTGDPALDEWGEYAGDLLTRSIDLAAAIDVIPASTVRDAIRATGSAAAPSATAIAKRTAASHIVTGTMRRVGGSIRFSIEVIDVRTVERLLSPDPVAGPADSLEAVIGRLAERTAAASLALFEPRPSWMQGYTLPATIGMYRDYLATFQLFCPASFPAVIERGNRVLDNSPGFIPVMGLVRFAYWNMGRTTDADSVHRRLEQLRDGMTPAERVEHDWMGALMDGDTALATRSAEAMFQIDPTSKYGFAAGFTAFRMRRLKDALDR
jgi:TolB-like protein